MPGFRGGIFAGFAGWFPLGTSRWVVGWFVADGFYLGVVPL